MTKEQILIKHCEGNQGSDYTYLDLKSDIIDGRASHALNAMDEYAIEFFLWVMHDHGEYKVERWEAEKYMACFKYEQDKLNEDTQR